MSAEKAEGGIDDGNAVTASLRNDEPEIIGQSPAPAAASARGQGQTEEETREETEI